MIESGLSQLPRGSWAGLLAPAGTPAAIVNRLNAELNAAMTTSQMKTALTPLGFEPMTASPQDFAVTIANEVEAWGKAAKSAGILPQ
jgi:tripartite-type tricarboxylate transporter receptor subunit TctC